QATWSEIPGSMVCDFRNTHATMALWLCGAFGSGYWALAHLHRLCPKASGNVPIQAQLPNATKSGASSARLYWVSGHFDT
ncbi:MAG: hypothetical protein ACK5A0_03735, partial [Polaromonas sp.]